VNKTLACQNAGAVAVIIVNLQGEPVIMGGFLASVTLPAVSVSNRVGTQIRATMQSAPPLLLSAVLPSTPTHPPGTSCSGFVLLTEDQGLFSDGTGNYSDNAMCSWLIKPSASYHQLRSPYIILTFDKFETEQGSDLIVVYAGDSMDAPVVGQFSGSNIPAPVGCQVSMLIVFTANGARSANGFIGHWSLSSTTTPSLAPTRPAVQKLVYLHAQPSGTSLAFLAAFGAASVSTPVFGKVVMANPPDACKRLRNADEVKGRIVLVNDTGGCVPVQKVLYCQEAGALAVIVASQGSAVVLQGAQIGISIPSVSVNKQVGESLKSLLPDLSLRLDEDPSDSATTRLPTMTPTLPVRMMAPNTARMANLKAGAPGNFRVFITGMDQFSVTVSRTSPSSSSLRIFINVGDVASSKEYVASNVPVASTTYTATVEAPVQSVFYYFSIISEQDEEVEVAVVATPAGSGGVSPVGAVFLTLGLILALVVIALGIAR
jgi:hypothetical protein